VPPIDQAGGQFSADQFLLQEELDDHPAKVLRHSLDIPEKDMHESAGFIEATLQNEAVVMGIPSLEGFTRKRTEILESAFRIGALDASDTLRVVPAENELLHDFRYPFYSKAAVNPGIFLFVLLGEALEVFLEQKLDRADSPLPIGRLLGRSKLKGQR
jgi:hypothetical protein